MRMLCANLLSGVAAVLWSAGIFLMEAGTRVNQAENRILREHLAMLRERRTDVA